MAKRLFLLDGMALIYRAHFAFIRSPIINSAGVNTSAALGFTNTLVDLLKKQEPTHLACVFDTSVPTFRHVQYPEYKAQRDAMPEELAAAIPHVKSLCEAFRIPVLTKDGFEADDIIGTLAKQADDAGGFETFMVTPDKDFAQLVSPTTSIYKPGRGGSDAEILTDQKILENWEIVRPDQVIDILGLWGDASDNIPGVPGIGEKTAKKLISQFDSIEGVLSSLDQLKGKQKENLTNHADNARLSRELATIKLDVPLDFGPADFELKDWNKDRLAELFAEYEFNAVGKRLLGKDFNAGRAARQRSAVNPDKPAGPNLPEHEGPPKTIADTKPRYKLLDSVDKRRTFAADLAKQESFCFDVETSALDPKDARLLGIAFSWKKGTGAYYVIPKDQAERDAALDLVRPILADAAKEKIGHNLKFDLQVLSCANVEVAGPFFDTMLAHALVEPGQRHGMDYCAEVYLHYKPISIDTLIGRDDSDGQQLDLLLDGDAAPSSLADVPLPKICKYASEDADVTWQLAGVLRPMVEEANLGRVLNDIENPLVPVLADIELEGIRVDTYALAAFGEVLATQIDELAVKIYAEAGTEFNLKSPKQLGEVLFDQMKLVDKPKKTTKTGQYVTNEQVLNQLAAEHPIAAHLLAYRESTKLKSTYVDALPEKVHPKTGRIHTNFNQLITDTGRLASSGPNLQNIPVRTAQGREIRRAFVPRDADHTLLAADYSQVELRIMASVSGDEAMRKAFAEDQDIHTATAARVYGMQFLDDVTSEQRRRAKMVNFGIIYGISAFGLAQRLRIPRREAADIISEYFQAYPGVKNYMDDTIEKAQKNGYVETLTGRRRYLRDITSRNSTVAGRAEREAINTPIQGSAADMIKLAMHRIAKALADSDLQSKMILQVHDELVFDCPKPEVEAVRTLATTEMQNALPLDGVPVVVDTGTGENWLEAH